MGTTAKQQKVFDKNQSTAKSMKEAVALQEKNVYANAEKNLKKLKAGKLGKNSRAKDSFKSKKAYLKENTARIKAGDKTTPTYAQWLNKPKKKAGRNKFEGASGSDLAELQKRFGGK